MAEQPVEPAMDLTMRPDHHGLGVHHPIDKPKKRGLFRRLLRWGMLLLAMVVLLVVLAPILLSTGPGTSLLVSLVNSRIVGEVAIDDLHLSWLEGQSIDGLRYTDAESGLAFDLREVRADTLGLFRYLTGKRDVGEVRVVGAAVTYDQPAVKPEVAPGQATAAARKRAFKLPPGLSGSVVFENLTVDYTAEGQEPVALSMPRGALELPGLREIRFDFAAALRQGERTGGLTLRGEVLNLFDPDGVIQPMQAGYQGLARVRGVPTAALGRLLSGMHYRSAPLSYLLGRPGRLAAILGAGDLDAQARLDGTINQLVADFVVESANLHVNLYSERDGDTLIASPRSSARLGLTAESFDALFPNSRLSLVEPTVVELSTLQMTLPRSGDGFDWDAASLAVEFKEDNSFALRDEDGEVIGVEGLRIGGGGASIAERLTFDVSATFTSVDAEGTVTQEPFKAELLVHRPLDADREVEFYSGVLPIALADALGGQEGRLVLWLGETLALQAELHGKVVTDGAGNPVVVHTYALRPEGRVTGEVTGEFDRLRYTFATADKQPIEAVLVPEAFASLMELVSGRVGEPALTIDQPMPVFITLRDDEHGEVSIATDPRRRGIGRFFPDADRTHLGVTIELTPARVYDPARDATYELRGGTLRVSSRDPRQSLKISAELDLWVRPDAGKDGVPALLSWQTTVTDILDSEGGIPLDTAALMQQIAMSGGVKLDHAPSGLFDSLLNRDGDIASILGPVVQQLDASFTYADGQPTGATVKLNWDEANNMPLPGAGASMRPVAFDIDADQMMTVRGGQDIELEVRVSEDFGDRWMGKLHPILFDAKSSDRPVRVTIDGSSFRFPMDSAAMAGAHVEAEIDLGSVQFGQDALLGKMLEWAKHPGENAVFEPARVSLMDGRISYDELDLAVGNVKLRLDGEIDLAKGEIVDMAVRVPGESLIRVFNELDGIIQADDYLSIPMTGAIRQPKFDPQGFSREVARMLTRGVVDRQRDNLRDRVRDELGIEEDQPGGAFVDQALDLIFGGRKKQ